MFISKWSIKNSVDKNKIVREKKKREKERIKNRIFRARLFSRFIVSCGKYTVWPTHSNFQSRVSLLNFRVKRPGTVYSEF